MKNRLKGIRLLFEDEDVIVIDKAAGVLSQALASAHGYSVEDALSDYVRKGQWKSSKCVYLVHRLDRETSGVMMVAKNESTCDYFRTHWNEVTEKVYLACVEGHMETTSGVFESYLKEEDNFFVHSVHNPKEGKLARTEWRVLATQNKPVITFVEVHLKSGRKNQIRVHFSEAHHPVLGDRKYGAHLMTPSRSVPLALHAWKLSFQHPRTKAPCSFISPPPSFWKACLISRDGVSHEW